MPRSTPISSGISPHIILFYYFIRRLQWTRMAWNDSLTDRHVSVALSATQCFLGWVTGYATISFLMIISFRVVTSCTINRWATSFSRTLKFGGQLCRECTVQLVWSVSIPLMALLEQEMFRSPISREYQPSVKPTDSLKMTSAHAWSWPWTQGSISFKMGICILSITTFWRQQPAHRLKLSITICNPPPN